MSLALKDILSKAYSSGFLMQVLSRNELFSKNYCRKNRFPRDFFKDILSRCTKIEINWVSYFNFRALGCLEKQSKASEGTFGRSQVVYSRSSSDAENFLSFACLAIIYYFSQHKDKIASGVAPIKNFQCPLGVS